MENCSIVYIPYKPYVFFLVWTQSLISISDHLKNRVCVLDCTRYLKTRLLGDLWVIKMPRAVIINSRDKRIHGIMLWTLWILYIQYRYRYYNKRPGTVLVCSILKVFILEFYLPHSSPFLFNLLYGVWHSLPLIYIIIQPFSLVVSICISIKESDRWLTVYINFTNKQRVNHLSFQQAIACI